MNRLLLAVLFAALVAVVPRAARAHQTSVVYVDLGVEGRVADLEVRIGMQDMGDPLGASLLVAPTRAQAEAGTARASQYVQDHVALSNGGAPCSPHAGPGLVRDRPVEGGWEFVATIRYACARQIDDLAIRYAMFFDLDPRAQAFARVRAFGATRELVLRDAQREARVQGAPSLLAQAGDYLVLGIEHIFTGYDHIAFLLGLLIIAATKGARGGVRYALGIVTAFTLAHSITLVSAALGWVHLPSRLVESAIAVSIFYVAAENLFPREPKRRWLLTFAFGLVHGFGFASVLGEMGLPTHGLVLSLLSFNAGVEVGQLIIVLLAFPILVLVARPAPWKPVHAAAVAALAVSLFVLLSRFELPPVRVAVVVFGGALAVSVAGRTLGYRRGVRVLASCVIGALALLWLGERVAGTLLFRGALG